MIRPRNFRQSKDCFTMMKNFCSQSSGQVFIKSAHRIAGLTKQQIPSSTRILFLTLRPINGWKCSLNRVTKQKSRSLSTFKEKKKSCKMGGVGSNWVPPNRFLVDKAWLFSRCLQEQIMLYFRNIKRKRFQKNIYNRERPLFCNLIRVICFSGLTTWSAGYTWGTPRIYRH